MNIVERKVALARGETVYFTGQPCKHGHVTYRYVKNGACSECVKKANGSQVNPMSDERRAAKLSFSRVNIRAYVEDRAAVAAAAYALAVMRFPYLLESDVDPKLLPTDRSGGTALYAFHVHDDDISTLRQIARGLMNTRQFDVEAARNKALNFAGGFSGPDTTPPMHFK